MTKARAKAGKKKTKAASAASRGSRKPVDLEAVRQQISQLVGSQAVGLVETTIGEADKGHYAAMKYLFELIGLYPATGEEEAAPGEDSLAKTLLKRLGVPEAEAEPALEPAITKDSPENAGAAALGIDAVE